MCLLASVSLLSAQTVGDREDLPLDARERPVATAYKVEEAPVMDGDVLDDPVWAVAPPLPQAAAATSRDTAMSGRANRVLLERISLDTLDAATRLLDERGRLPSAAQHIR